MERNLTPAPKASSNNAVKGASPGNQERKPHRKRKRNREKFFILTINPGSTSTKIGVFANEKMLFKEDLQHPKAVIEKFIRIPDQYDFRKKMIERALEARGWPLANFHAIVARGGTCKPLESGTWIVNEKMVDDLANRPMTAHISNLAAIIAHELSRQLNVPAFIVDPVCVDEMIPPARLSGLPELPRLSLFHALNIRATARLAAKRLKKPLEKLALLMVHLGSGITVCPLLKGRAIDVNNANDAGPMATERSGTLPAQGLIKLCFSGRVTREEMLDRVSKKGGLFAHLGTNDLAEVESRIARGDPHAELILETMAYQLAKEIGAMATVLKGKVDRIVFTGGMARSKGYIKLVRERVQWIAPTLVFPGENELQALAAGGYRVLACVEKARDYV